MRLFSEVWQKVSSATPISPTREPASKVTGSAPETPWIERVPIVGWALLASMWFLVTALYPDASRFLETLGDTDDATRLYQVREWLAGAGWFDLTLSRIGAPEPLVSHWSRLVDVPVGFLIWISGLIVTQDTAEFLVRLIWPLMLLTAMSWIMARDTASRAGNHVLAAALFAIALTIFAHAGVTRFMPGRLDHHNLMILSAIGGLLFLAESFNRRTMAIPAGILLGFGTAVGYEAIVLTFGGLIAAGLYAVSTARGIDIVARVCQAFAATLGLCLVLTTPLSALTSAPCDALGLNTVVLAVAGAAGLTIVAHFQSQLTLTAKLAILAGFAATGLASALAVEPACAKGPFAALTPEVKDMWLARVQETQTLFALMIKKPAGGLVFLVTMAVGLWAAETNRRYDKDARSTLQLIFLALAGLFALWQIKFTPYASFLIAPPLALALTRLKPFGELSKLGTMLMAYLLVNPLTIALVIILSTNALGLEQVKTAEDENTSKSCMASASIRPLADLPPGLIATHFDFGPFIVALTPHRVVSAPYHRLGPAIAAFEALDAGPPADAYDKLTALGATYVVQCKDWVREERAENSLHKALHRGEVPDYLEPVSLKDDTPFRVWRVAPRRP
jgi:hypothetical protein